MVQKILVDVEFETRAANLLFAELVSEVEHVRLQVPVAIVLAEEVGPEVVLPETLVRLDSQTENVSAAQLQINDRVVVERCLVDLFVQVQVEVALNVRLAAFCVEVAFERKLVLVVEVPRCEVC